MNMDNSQNVLRVCNNTVRQLRVWGGGGVVQVKNLVSFSFLYML